MNEPFSYLKLILFILDNKNITIKIILDDIFNYKIFHNFEEEEINEEKIKFGNFGFVEYNENSVYIIKN